MVNILSFTQKEIIHSRCCYSPTYYRRLASDLELMLRSRGIDTIIITGVVTNGCVANTVRGARERDLYVIVLSDCCACMMPEDDEYFIKNVFPSAGRVRTSDEMVAVISGERVAVS